MYNWLIDEKIFKKEDPEGYRGWRLERMKREEFLDFFKQPHALVV